jgi:hypothetical protein
MKTAVAFLVTMLFCFATAGQEAEDPDILSGIRGAPCKQPPKVILTLGLIEASCQANRDKNKNAACVYLGKMIFPGDLMLICGLVAQQDSCMKPWEFVGSLRCSKPPEKGEQVKL